jgi:hypothetical protein
MIHQTCDNGFTPLNGENNRKVMMSQAQLTPEPQ